MGCHIYLYDKHGREIPGSSLRIGMAHEGKSFRLQLDAHRFVAGLRREFRCREMSDEDRMDVLKRSWRGQPVAPADVAAISLDWIEEIINTAEFDRLECG